MANDKKQDDLAKSLEEPEKEPEKEKTYDETIKEADDILEEELEW